CLLEVEVAGGGDHGVSLRVLPYDQHVDDADDPIGLQPVELGQDLAPEAVAREREGDHLDRAEILHRSRPSLHRTHSSKSVSSTGQGQDVATVSCFWPTAIPR